MALISLKDVSLRFGGPPLLDEVNLHMEEGDRLCLLGRNGTGKSSLLRLIAGEYTADHGQLSISRDAHVSYLEQDSDTRYDGTALEYCLAHASTDVDARKFLTRLGMDPDAKFATLSGGGQRRVMLAATLSSGADVMLLDEPTNHLDIQTVLWLEDHLKGQVKTLILVTHDRAFARAVANRTADLDRGRLSVCDCGLDEFLRRSGEQLTAEVRRQAVFDKKLAVEEAWLRRGVKARRTRNEGRVRALLKMREEYQQRRARPGQLNLRVQDAGRSGSLVVETSDLTFGYPRTVSELENTAAPLIHKLTTTIVRGDKVGIVGPNGAGKTTLVRLLLGGLEPQSGSVRTGTNVRPLYFDQVRDTLDSDRTVIENLTGGDEMVIVNGKSKHINAYLQDFLFDPDHARSEVRVLSGGEKNRLLLAKLFLQPSNLLVMDEPTNDLDIETLDLLEEMLLNYPGTLLLVTHDRELLDNVVTNCLVFTGSGRIAEFAGGYSDWEDRAVAAESAVGTLPKPVRPVRKAIDRSSVPKLSFKENRELAELPTRITTLEERIAHLHETMSNPELYRQEPEKIAGLAAELTEKEAQLAASFERWEELDGRAR